MSDNLYLVAEQKDKEYEILSLIIQDSPAPKVSALRGLIVGIGVQNDRSSIAARPIVAVRRKSKINDWKTSIDKELGYIPQGKVPEMIRRELRAERP